MNGKQADLSPEAWCKAVRFYQNALGSTPQPARDWIVLTEIENQKRLVSMLTTLTKKLGASPNASLQSPAAPKVFDYAEVVRQRIRPLIVWDGTVVHGETVVEVHCTSSGNLESAKIVRASSDARWDSAALSAVRRADPMPLDETGQARKSFLITLRPGL